MGLLSSVLIAVALGAPSLAAADAPTVHATSAPPAEARISIDFKDADIVDIVRLLSEVGNFQVVIDPGTSCKLTLKLPRSSTGTCRNPAKPCLRGGSATPPVRYHICSRSRKCPVRHACV